MTNDPPHPLTGFIKSECHRPNVAKRPTPGDEPVTGPVASITAAEANQVATFSKIRARLLADHRPLPTIAGLADMAAPELVDFAEKRTAALPMGDAQRLVEVVFDGVRLTYDCVLVADAYAGLNLNTPTKQRGEKAAHAKEIAAPVTNVTRSKTPGCLSHRGLYKQQLISVGERPSVTGACMSCFGGKGWANGGLKAETFTRIALRAECLNAHCEDDLLERLGPGR